MKRRLNSQAHHWMTAPETRAVMGALGEARFVGGAVRNALLGQPVTEVDIATPLTPDEVTKRLVAADLRAVPTGIEHGTIIAVVQGTPFEITSLRRDVATDGRRAIVAFTNDWCEDAARRDFTMNALYAAVDGEIFDYATGIADLEAGHVRFMGEPAARIREDYLRILRLFRFHAWYGRGEVDAEALHAAAAEKAGLARLSGERIQKEMLRLLEAADPLPAMRVMADTGILSEIIPGWINLSRLERLLEIGRLNGFPSDPLLRLAALMPDEETALRVAERFRLSNDNRDCLLDNAGTNEEIAFSLAPEALGKLLYRIGAERFRDRVLLHWAEDTSAANVQQLRALLALADSWQRPRLPLSGSDVLDAGVAHGVEVGRILKEMEAWWIDAGFPEDRELMLERLRSVVRAMPH